MQNKNFKKVIEFASKCWKYLDVLNRLSTTQWSQDKRGPQCIVQLERSAWNKPKLDDLSGHHHLRGLEARAKPGKITWNRRLVQRRIASACHRRQCDVEREKRHDHPRTRITKTPDADNDSKGCSHSEEIYKELREKGFWLQLGGWKCLKRG